MSYTILDGSNVIGGSDVRTGVMPSEQAIDQQGGGKDVIITGSDVFQTENDLRITESDVTVKPLSLV